MLLDVQAAVAAHRAGVGACISVTLGGRHAPELCGEPLRVEGARVMSLSDGRFTLVRGYPFDTGCLPL
jgi:microcystin degradation protein MlrC